MYLEALRTLDKDPLAGLVSPPLFGTSGVVPLSIISVIPDIIKHYADVIVRARKEVFLATVRAHTRTGDTSSILAVR